MLTTEQQLLLIGQVARKSNIPIKTIRYYEQLGLIKASDRTSGGFRLFDPSVFTRLAFIKRSQSLGLSLQEIAQCLQVYDRGELPCDEIKHKLQAKLVEIEGKIEHWQGLKADICQLLTAWKPVSEKPDKICPIIQKD